MLSDGVLGVPRRTAVQGLIGRVFCADTPQNSPFERLTQETMIR